MKPDIVVDFAQTIVHERPMVKWVLFVLIYGDVPLWRKLHFMLNSFIRGLLSVIFGEFRASSAWAARLAYMSFKGISEETLEHMVNHKKRNSMYMLSLNSKLIGILSSIKQERGIDPSQSLGISVLSQGTCMRAIELFKLRQDVAEALDQAGLHISFINANQLEVINGKFTGRLTGQIITRHNKPKRIPKGGVFVGDSKDEKIVSKLRNKNFEFINCEKVGIQT